jgi:hypothetical protein
LLKISLAIDCLKSLLASDCKLLNNVFPTYLASMGRSNSTKVTKLSHHNIAEILLKLGLNTNQSINQSTKSSSHLSLSNLVYYCFFTTFGKLPVIIICVLDFNECDYPGYCDQGCKKKNGDYLCSCVPGYRWSQERF